MEFWVKILGFKPMKTLEIKCFEPKCYKCDSKNIEKLKSGPWTGKFKCADCGYFTYVVYSDLLSGDWMDSVAIDSKESNLI